MIAQYALNVLIGLDQFANAIIGGDPDRTISGRLGRAHLAGIKWTEPLRIAVDWFFRQAFGHYNHCINSIERDEDGRGVWDWSS